MLARLRSQCQVAHEIVIILALSLDIYVLRLKKRGFHTDPSTYFQPLLSLLFCKG